MYGPYLRREGIELHLLVVMGGMFTQLECFSKENLSLSSIQLFIQSAQTHEYILYTLDYNPKSYYLLFKMFQLWPLGALSLL